jgi:hypothetical protein
MLFKQRDIPLAQHEHKTPVLSKTDKVYNALLSRAEQVVTSDDIKKIAKHFKMNARAGLDGLKRNGALEPVLFRGIYYVRNRDEQELQTIRVDPLRIIARACNAKIGRNWYFGLATALKLAGAWGQQTLTTITIITKKRVQHSRSSFGGYVVEFKAISIPSFESNLRIDGDIRYSAPVRTLLDYAYLGARHGDAVDYTRQIISDIPRKDRKRLLEEAEQLVAEYPRLYQIFLDRLLMELRNNEVRPNSG